MLAVPVLLRLYSRKDRRVGMAMAMAMSMRWWAVTKDRDFSLLNCSTGLAARVPQTGLPLRTVALVDWDSMCRISESVAGLLLLGGC
jgi:hypothetical protein